MISDARLAVVQRERTALSFAWLLRKLIDDWLRYVRLYGLLLRTCLLREMMFRANFLVRLLTHLHWLGLMLAFLKVIFLHARRIGDWDQTSLLFFMGTYLTLNATVNCLFMTGCGRLSELIRTGNLDFELLKPIDEQFLVTFQRIDWALLPQILLGLAIAAFASIEAGLAVSISRLISYFALLGCGEAILYSLLVVLAAVSVWTVRHEELYELWFYMLQFANRDWSLRTVCRIACLRGTSGATIACSCPTPRDATDSQNRNKTHTRPVPRSHRMFLISFATGPS